MADKPYENNPWLTLSTVNTFDKGNHSWTTRRIDEMEIQGGGQIVGRIAPATSLLIESLIQQLCTIFEGDTSRRNKLYYAICDRLHEMKLIDSSYNKIEFETMRGQYQIALYKLVAVARSLTGSESSLQVPNCLIAEWSRYRREFIEIGFIAAGGFGNVFKAQHRLDGYVYAIKKIVVRSGRVKTIMKHLEEVKTIARLNHTNIVSYKGAWIEQTFLSTFTPSLPEPTEISWENSQFGEPADNEITNSRRKNDIDKNVRMNAKPEGVELCVSEILSSGENNRTSKKDNFTYKTGMYISNFVNKSSSEIIGSNGGYIISHDIINERFQRLNSTTNIIGERISERIASRIDDEELSDVVSFRSETRESKITNDDSNASQPEESYVDEINHTESLDESDSREESASEQRLCKFDSSPSTRYAILYIQMALCDQTLRQWLDERKESTPIHIVTAILTQILSGLEYIHSLDIVHHDIKPSNIFISKSGKLQIQLGDFGLACPLQREGHHSVLGTPTYAAPEQLNGICDPKSDVYSLGIVLFELLVPMQTYMERSKVIAALKNGKVPTSLTTKYPEWAQIILQLVQTNPKKRLSPTELLRHLSEDKDSIIARLKEENVMKDNIIQELQDRIAQLNAKMEEYQISLDNT